MSNPNRMSGAENQEMRVRRLSDNNVMTITKEDYDAHPDHFEKLGPLVETTEERDQRATAGTTGERSQTPSR